jgi:hypothetical protein
MVGAVGVAFGNATLDSSGHSRSKGDVLETHAMTSIDQSAVKDVI